MVSKPVQQLLIFFPFSLSLCQCWEPGTAAQRGDEGGHPGQRFAASRGQKCWAHPADCQEAHHLFTEEHSQAAAQGAGGKKAEQSFNLSDKDQAVINWNTVHVEFPFLCRRMRKGGILLAILTDFAFPFLGMD